MVAVSCLYMATWFYVHVVDCWLIHNVSVLAALRLAGATKRWLSTIVGRNQVITFVSQRHNSRVIYPGNTLLTALAASRISHHRREEDDMQYRRYNVYRPDGSWLATLPAPDAKALVATLNAAAKLFNRQGHARYHCGPFFAPQPR